MRSNTNIPAGNRSLPCSRKYKMSMCKIDIADNGLGIDLKEHKENLFSLYKRFHFHVDGRGLGLYLVKTQVTALGGEIDVNSKEGEGTVFSLWIKNVHSPETTARD